MDSATSVDITGYCGLFEANAIMLEPATSSTFCEIRATPWAGRGMFAQASIPASTVVLVSPEPIAHVILQPFRHEVCDWCFAYDNGKRWTFSYDVEDRKSKRGVAWFCSEDCLQRWCDRMGDLGIEAWLALDQALTTARRSRSADKSKEQLRRPTDTTAPTIPTSDVVEARWEECKEKARLILAARMANQPDKMDRRLLRDEHQLALLELDHDDAYFLLTGVLSLWRAGPLEDTHSATVPGTWQALLELQPSISLYLDNDSPIARHIAAVHLLTCILPLPLLPYCTTLNALRLFSRDSCNSFGIRSQTHGSESEFLGYGIWPTASYFNHSCRPNIVKQTPGRTWVFESGRDILPDEELRISYLGDSNPDEMDVEQRRKQLKQTWGFDCDCQLCLAQLGSTI